MHNMFSLDLRLLWDFHRIPHRKIKIFFLFATDFGILDFNDKFREKLNFSSKTVAGKWKKHKHIFNEHFEKSYGINKSSGFHNCLYISLETGTLVFYTSNEKDHECMESTQIKML